MPGKWDVCQQEVKALHGTGLGEMSLVLWRVVVDRFTVFPAGLCLALIQSLAATLLFLLFLKICK